MRISEEVQNHSHIYSTIFDFNVQNKHAFQFKHKILQWNTSYLKMTQKAVCDTWSKTWFLNAQVRAGQHIYTLFVHGDDVFQAVHIQGLQYGFFSDLIKLYPFFLYLICCKQILHAAPLTKPE